MTKVITKKRKIDLQSPGGQHRVPLRRSDESGKFAKYVAEQGHRGILISKVLAAHFVSNKFV